MGDTGRRRPQLHVFWVEAFCLGCILAVRVHVIEDVVVSPQKSTAALRGAVLLGVAAFAVVGDAGLALELKALVCEVNVCR